MTLGFACRIALSFWVLREARLLSISLVVYMDDDLTWDKHAKSSISTKSQHTKLKRWSYLFNWISWLQLGVNWSNMRFFKSALPSHAKCPKSTASSLDVGKAIHLPMNCKSLSSFWLGLPNRGSYVFRSATETKLKSDLDSQSCGKRWADQITNINLVWIALN